MRPSRATGRLHSGWHYRPGEIVVAVELPEGETLQRDAFSIVRSAMEKQAGGRSGGVFDHAQPPAPPIVIPAPGKPPLGFFFYDLVDLGAVKSVIQSVQGADLESLRGLREVGITPVAVMPDWLASAAQEYARGAGVTMLPRLAKPPADDDEGSWRFSYAPIERSLDLRARANRAPMRAVVEVALLDNRPDLRLLLRQSVRFRKVNAQLADLTEVLQKHAIPEWHESMLAYMDRENLRLAPSSRGPRLMSPQTDHGLFMAGLIHDLAPRADLRLLPILNRWGVGDLKAWLRVLSFLVNSKRPESAVVVTMGFTLLPPLEHLPSMWFGVEPRDDPDFVPDEPRPLHDVAWLTAHHGEVERTCELLHKGVRRVTEYLSANNCLVVAPVGNDSIGRVERGLPRFGPAVPACYESVLGVAATTGDGEVPADYSNRTAGDLATFGGGVDRSSDELRDGVIGLFSATHFPGISGAENDSGWAEWAGTSFATALLSGVVANYWAVRRRDRLQPRAETIMEEFRRHVGYYLTSVDAHSLRLTGDWQRV